ncbi:MAG TPA: hypothetical protein VK553_09280, partial [Candidatus Nitrosopolaris rasttigaisensis]|nr:hypothetical protein [Candidatus Nitrosopolaris rasttigaisensis]
MDRIHKKTPETPYKSTFMSMEKKAFIDDEITRLKKDSAHSQEQLERVEKTLNKLNTLQRGFDDAEMSSKALVDSDRQLEKLQKEVKILEQVLGEIKGQKNTQQEITLRQKIQEGSLQRYSEDIKQLIKEAGQLSRNDIQFGDSQFENINKSKNKREECFDEIDAVIEITNDASNYGISIDFSTYLSKHSPPTINSRSGYHGARENSERLADSIAGKKNSYHESRDKMQKVLRKLDQENTYAKIQELKFRCKCIEAWIAVIDDNNIQKAFKKLDLQYQFEKDRTYRKMEELAEGMKAIATITCPDVENLEKSVVLLDEALKHVQLFKQGVIKQDQIEYIHNRFLEEHGSQKEEIRGYQEVKAIYEALISHQDTAESNKDIAEKGEKAKIRLDGIEFLKGAINTKNSLTQLRDSNLFVNQYRAFLETLKKDGIEKVRQTEEYKETLDLYRALSKQRGTCYNLYTTLRKDLQAAIHTFNDGLESPNENKLTRMNYERHKIDYIAKKKPHYAKALEIADLMTQYTSSLTAQIDYYDSRYGLYIGWFEATIHHKQQEIGAVLEMQRAQQPRTPEDVGKWLDQLIPPDQLTERVAAILYQSDIQKKLDSFRKLFQEKYAENKENLRNKQKELLERMKSLSLSSVADSGPASHDGGEQPEYNLLSYYTKEYEVMLGITPDETEATKFVKDIQKRFASEYHETAAEVDIHLRKTFNKTLYHFSYDEEGNAVLNDTSELGKLPFDWWGNLTRDNKKVKIYAKSDYMGIKAADAHFCANTPAYLGGNPGLKDLLELEEGNMNVLHIGLKREVSEESQGRLKATKVREDEKRDVEKQDRLIMHFVKYNLEANQPYMQEDSQGTQVTRLDNSTTKDRREMQALVKIDFDDLRHDQTLTNQSTPDRIQKAVINHLFKKGAMQDMPKFGVLSIFPKSETGKRLIEEIREHLNQVHQEVVAKPDFD